MVFRDANLVSEVNHKKIFIMKLQNEKKRKKRLVLKIIFGLIIGISFGFGIGKMVKSNKSLVSSIEKSLQQNCNCESVLLENGAIGIQFSKQDGFSNLKIDITLKNCTFYSSAEKEANRLNNMLERDVQNYNSVDFITFYFKSKEGTETVKIKDGNIL